MRLPIDEQQLRILILNQITTIINSLTYKDEGDVLNHNITFLLELRSFVKNMNFIDSADIQYLISSKALYHSYLKCLQTTMYREVLDRIIDTIIITFNNYQGKN